MEILIKDEAKKQIKKLPKSELKKVISKIEKLSQNQSAGKYLHGELEGLQSLRAWPYRIIYRCDRTTITIFSIGHRKDVYKSR